MEKSRSGIYLEIRHRDDRHWCRKNEKSRRHPRPRHCRKDCCRTRTRLIDASRNRNRCGCPGDQGQKTRQIIAIVCKITTERKINPVWKINLVRRTQWDKSTLRKKSILREKSIKLDFNKSERSKKKFKSPHYSISIKKQPEHPVAER